MRLRPPFQMETISILTAIVAHNRWSRGGACGEREREWGHKEENTVVIHFFRVSRRGGGKCDKKAIQYSRNDVIRGTFSSVRPSIFPSESHNKKKGRKELYAVTFLSRKKKPFLRLNSFNLSWSKDILFRLARVFSTEEILSSFCDDDNHAVLFFAVCFPWDLRFRGAKIKENSDAEERRLGVEKDFSGLGKKIRLVCPEKRDC